MCAMSAGKGVTLVDGEHTLPHHILPNESGYYVQEDGVMEKCAEALRLDW